MNISIVNDLINEPVERFSLSLTADPDLDLILDTHAGEVRIIDDDGMRVNKSKICTLFSESHRQARVGESYSSECHISEHIMEW